MNTNSDTPERDKHFEEWAQCDSHVKDEHTINGMLNTIERLERELNEARKEARYHRDFFHNSKWAKDNLPWYY